MTTTYKVTIEGIRPLLMHNGCLADPLNEHAKAIKVFSKQRNKTDDDLIELARLEFVGGMYYDRKEGPIMPTDNLQACMLEGARMRKNGPIFQTFVEVLPGDLGDELFGYRLEYQGPRTLEQMWGEPKFRLTKGVRVNQARITRTRPKFDRWSCTFILDVAEGGPTEDQILTTFTDAGVAKGLGDWTPRYGRFKVTQLAAT